MKSHWIQVYFQSQLMLTEIWTIFCRLFFDSNPQGEIMGWVKHAISYSSSSPSEFPESELSIACWVANFHHKYISQKGYIPVLRMESLKIPWFQEPHGFLSWIYLNLSGCPKQKRQALHSPRTKQQTKTAAQQTLHTPCRVISTFHVFFQINLQLPVRAGH